MNVSGKLLKYSYEEETGSFLCLWLENPEIHASTKIFIPDLSQVDKDNIIITPETEGAVLERIKDSDSGFLVIFAVKTSQQRKLSFSIQAEADKTINF